MMIETCRISLIFNFCHVKNWIRFPSILISSKSDIGRGSYGHFTKQYQNRPGLTVDLTDRQVLGGPSSVPSIQGSDPSFWSSYDGQSGGSSESWRTSRGLSGRGRMFHFWPRVTDDLVDGQIPDGPSLRPLIWGKNILVLTREWRRLGGPSGRSLQASISEFQLFQRVFWYFSPILVL